MVDLPLREERNTLRQVIIRAQNDDVMTQEEAGFVITLIERFRKDIEKKERLLLTLQGEISQLRTNEQVIIQLIESMISAAERDLARQETMQKLKEARAVEEERHVERAERNANQESQEQGDLPLVPPALTR
jgi:hypothetical protein